MYLPMHFREDRLETLHALIAARPLGTLIAQGPSGLDASLLTFLIDADASPRGSLRAHLARANGQWRTLATADEAMVVFQDQGVYVSPGWYATKRETGKVAPTWNYVAVACWGRPTIIDDAGWLRALVDALTARHEQGRAAPWATTDAPPTFIEGQLKGIVGLEIPIERLEGKWKVSQNRTGADRAGVAQGLDAEGADAARAMAALVRERGESRSRTRPGGASVLRDLVDDVAHGPADRAADRRAGAGPEAAGERAAGQHPRFHVGQVRAAGEGKRRGQQRDRQTRRHDGVPRGERKGMSGRLWMQPTKFSR